MKNENFKLIVTGLLVLLGASTFVYVGNNVIPTHYQFNPEIWGTVSDWMVIFLMLVTAVFLYKTLRSQQEVQKMQQRITDIEDFKFRRELLPHFEVKGISPIYNTPEIQTKYHIINLGEPAKNIVVRTEGKTKDGDSISKEWTEKLINNGQKLNIHQNLNRSSNDEYFKIRITVVYEDQAGNRYMQYAEIIKPNQATQSFGERTLPTPIQREQII